MPIKSSEFIHIKRLKKDGSINQGIIKQVAAALRSGETAVLPVDNIYAIAGLATPEMEKRISRATGRTKKSYVRLISSYRMLDELAWFSKSDYDFLNRIWPGEITVVFRKKQAISPDETIAVRFPKSKFLLAIIEEVESPIIVSNLYKPAGKNTLYRKNEILNTCRDSADLILIIEELCRKHPLTSVIDISSSTLRIIKEGKVSAEEIKSLFFLSVSDTPGY